MFFALPLSLIAYYSLGHKPDFLTPISMQGLGLSSYRAAVSGPFLQTFRNTLTIAVVGTTLCLLIAFPFAYAVAVRMAPRWRGLAIGLVMIPFWTSFLIRTIGWISSFPPMGGCPIGCRALGYEAHRSDPRHPVCRATRRRLQLPAAR